MRRLLVGGALAGCLLAPPVAAQDWGGDDDWGSDDDAVEVPVTIPAPQADTPSDHRFSFGGFVRRDEAWWTDRGALAKLRHSLDLEAEYRWQKALKVRASVHTEHDQSYAIIGQGNFDPEQVDAYEARVLPGDLYVSYGLGAVEITVGRQIVAWGEGDALSPLDVVNPRDNREPGLADLDDLRLAVLASRVGWFIGDHRLEVMAVHESYFGEFAPPMADYSPFSSLVAGPSAQLLAGKRIRYVHAQDRFALANQAALARWIYKGPGLDLGLYLASVLDRQGVVRLPSITLATLGADHIDLTLDHQRYTVVGTSGATSSGSWLLKWELAGQLGKAYNTGDVSGAADATAIPALDVETAHTLTAMGAVGYSGFADTQLAVEVQRGLQLSGPDDLLVPIDVPIVAARAQQTWLRERLTLMAGATAIGLTADRGWLLRAEATYEVLDGLKVGAGYITYHSGDADKFGPFTGFDQHDRVFSKLRYDFGQSW